MMMRITKPLVSNVLRTHPSSVRTLGIPRAVLLDLHRPPLVISSFSTITSIQDTKFSPKVSTVPFQLHHNQQQQHQMRWSSTSNGDTSTNATTESDESKEAPQPNEPEGANSSENPAEDPLESTEADEEGPIEPEPVADAVPASALLQKEIRDLKDHLRRSLADQENTRNIARRDVKQAREFAIKSFAKSLLDVADNLQRALDAVPAEYRPSENTTKSEEEHPMQTTFKKLYEGIEMTEKGLKRAFANHGLVPFGQVGEPFDPSKHDALMDYDDPNAPENSVGILMKCGYTLHDLVLRPAEVGVVVRKTPPPSDAPPAETTNESSSAQS